MSKTYPIHLNERIHLIDGFDLGVAERTGIYVINEEELTLVDTGPSPSVKHIKAGFQALGLWLKQVKYIIVTHVHLDHAGGAGLLLKECPNATVVVHPKGARHLVDTGRLVASASMVYGDRFSELFDPVISIPEERLLVRGEGETLKIGPTSTLEFWDTPGHANHHFSIYDSVSNGVFSGDTVGIRYEQLIGNGVNLFLPTTSPNQFNPNDMQSAIDRMLKMDLNYIYFGHFGMTDTPNIALKQVSEWLAIFMEIGMVVDAEQKDYLELAKRLTTLVRDHLSKLAIGDNHSVFELIELDMLVSAMGIMDYFAKK